MVNILDNEVCSSDESESPNGWGTSFIEMNDGANSSSSEESGNVNEEESESDPEVDDATTEDPPVVPENGIENSNALTQEEIALIRMQLRRELGNHQLENLEMGKRDQRVFRVPKEHPVFDGEPENLEPFIVEMELTHAKETNGRARDEHNPDFITKLLPYFKEGTSARTWFKMYASRRTRLGVKLTWKRLVRDLRGSYGVFEQPDLQFEEYYDMQQSKDDVKTYIAKKCEAALMSEDLTPRLLKFGFIRGLNPDIRNYVKLQKPTTLEEAQRIAIDYSNSMKQKRHKPEHGGKSERNQSERNQSINSNSRPRKRNREDEVKLNDLQKKALSELRKLRKDRCFNCGMQGHRREDCKSDRAVVKKHRDMVTELRNKINSN